MRVRGGAFKRVEWLVEYHGRSISFAPIPAFARQLWPGDAHEIVREIAAFEDAARVRASLGYPVTWPSWACKVMRVDRRRSTRGIGPLHPWSGITAVAVFAFGVFAGAGIAALVMPPS